MRREAKLEAAAKRAATYREQDGSIEADAICRQLDEALATPADDSEPVAWRVRVKSDDPEEWSLLPAGGGAHYLGRDGYEVQPLYKHPSPSISDEMVERACLAWGTDVSRRKMRRVLKAASLPAVETSGIAVRSAEEILADAEPLPAAEREPVVAEATVERVRQRISVYAEQTPENDETWESWYRAAFDMLASEIDEITAILSHQETKEGE